MNIKVLYIALALSGLSFGAVAQNSGSLTADSDTIVKEIRGEDFSRYEEMTREGSSEGMRCLAFCYLRGEGVRQDNKEALQWFARACREGNTEAQYNVGELYLSGEGVAKDTEIAAYWFRKAARNGHSQAQVSIARMFAEGEGVLQDYRMALENYWRAAAQGNAEGEYALAVMLRDGLGTEARPGKARYWFERAATGGYKDAAYQASLIKVPADASSLWDDKNSTKRTTRTSAAAGSTSAKNREKGLKAQKTDFMLKTDKNRGVCK